jgi:hypothetical protein
VSVWLTIPSARRPQEANPILQKWAEKGYQIAVWRDAFDGSQMLADLWIEGLEYPGYAEAVNRLIRVVMERKADAEWFVIGGDDTLPDPNKPAEEIAAECRFRFYNALIDPWTETFGVMQPTGDRYAGGQIDRICGSAWIGREFAQRAYQGNGPLFAGTKCWNPLCHRGVLNAMGHDETCPTCKGAGEVGGYTHMFVDEELQEVAKAYGVLWQRPDLIQKHMRYDRESEAIDSGAVHRRTPDHILHDGYTPEHWVKYQRLFLERRMAGFPGSELL